GAARRPPDDRGARPLHRRVRGSRRGDDVGPRRGAAAPAPHRSRDQGARREGRRRPEPVDAGGEPERDRRRRRLRAGDVGEPRLRRPDFHPPQRVQSTRGVRAARPCGQPGAGGDRRWHRSAQRGARRRGRREHHRRRLRGVPHAGSRARDPRAQGARQRRRRFGVRSSARSGRPEPRRRPVSSPQTTSRLRVRYAETDQMGVVYYANYLVWFEVGRTDLLRESGWNYRDMESDGFSLPVIEARCIYHASAKYDDDIEVRTTGAMLSPIRVQFTYQVARPSDAATLATGVTVHATLDRAGKPCRLPARVRTLFT